MFGFSCVLNKYHMLSCCCPQLVTTIRNFLCSKSDSFCKGGTIKLNKCPFGWKSKRLFFKWQAILCFVYKNYWTIWLSYSHLLTIWLSYWLSYSQSKHFEIFILFLPNCSLKMTYTFYCSTLEHCPTFSFQYLHQSDLNDKAINY